MDMERTALLKGRLEAFEVAYGEITERDLIVSRPDENGRGVYVFPDDCEARSLTEAAAYAQTMCQFAVNQLRQRHSSIA